MTTWTHVITPMPKRYASEGNDSLPDNPRARVKYNKRKNIVTGIH